MVGRGQRRPVAHRSRAVAAIAPHGASRGILSLTCIPRWLLDAIYVNSAHRRARRISITELSTVNHRPPRRFRLVEGAAGDGSWPGGGIRVRLSRHSHPD